MAIDKLKLKNLLLSEIDKENSIIESSVNAAVEAATDTESKPENKYDTRALEASYLAGAQGARLEELKGMRTFLNSMSWTSESTSIIKALSLIQLEHEGILGWFLLLPFGAGYILQSPDAVVQTITTHSPLGKAMLGKQKGDLIEVLIAGVLKEYEVISVC